MRDKETAVPCGYQGKILHVDLATGGIDIEQPDERFYRKYVGGSAMGAYYLLKHTPAHADPLGPENTLSLMTGVVVGAPVSGQSRVVATAKSPATDLVGDSQAGGFWPAELKFAGFDGIVIHGEAEEPVYLWIEDGEAELRDAEHLWGRFTADVEDAIREELGDERIQVIQCGPAAEKGVRFSALINYANRANGRTGMGLVMASKNLKAVAVRGHKRPEMADPNAVRKLGKWGVDHFEESDIYGLGLLGTAQTVTPQNRTGGLPTRNWTSGVFQGADAISGSRMSETILKDRDTCYGCVVRCKRVVETTGGAYEIDPRYGGPEYETLATMGSYCGVSDLEAIAYANQLCNMYGMDTISCGATIAWAMECYEQELIGPDQTDGIELRFGNADALAETVRRMGERAGFGRVLGEGSARAAEILGVGQELVVAVKKQEYPAHMPEAKRSMALIYAVNPFGADHQSHQHDPTYRGYPDRMAELDLLDPQPSKVLNPEKVRFAVYTQRWNSLVDSATVCQFVWGPSWQLYDPNQLVDLFRGVTGWDVSLWELMKVGERRLNLLRAFNAREGVGAEADTLPAKMTIPLQGGPSDGVAVTQEEVEEAKALYYQMAGWDGAGRPTRAKLEELALGWVADELNL
jgi:aldehyde:ferredoxin oxidoreductase